MSNLGLPRIHFRGEFSTNVYTANNDDYQNPQFVDSANVAVDTLGKSDADFATWMRGFDVNAGMIRAGWNLYGDGATIFNNTTAHSLQKEPVEVITDPAADPLVGATVSLNQAVMVDLDPKGVLGTQIFCDQFLIQKRGLTISGKPTRFHTRWVSQRNLNAGGFTGAAAVWHAVVPADQLTIAGTGSDTLDLFKEAKTAGKGLFIRFVTYLLAPKLSNQQLASDFAHNLTTENPAVGRVLGTVGLWSPTEMTTIPQGRRLDSNATITSDHASYSLSPAAFGIDSKNHVLSLDLINAFPEINDTLTKVNLGEVNAYLETSPTGTVARQLLGAVAYDRTSYEQSGGMIDIIYGADLETEVESGRVVLIQESSGTRILEEVEQTVETDDRCVYLEQNQQGALHLKLLRKGGSPGEPVTLRLAQYITSKKSLNPATPAIAVLNLPEEVTTDADGLATLPLQPALPGTCIVAFILPESSSDDLTYFANVRVLPTDDYSTVNDSELTFKLIYNEVLKYYYLLYPSMNRQIDLSNENKMKFKAQFVRERIDAKFFESWSYMPRTRELSAGKRQLLKRWCDKEIPGS